ncbi:hypothetical protein MYX07_03330 [Patescibacteria group bacterium AH-259-L07]|nr:hypothetical protein [Patescibacteria group bacterium AH-259-L07]
MNHQDGENWEDLYGKDPDLFLDAVRSGEIDLADFDVDGEAIELINEFGDEFEDDTIISLIEGNY